MRYSGGARVYVIQLLCVQQQWIPTYGRVLYNASVTILKTDCAPHFQIVFDIISSANRIAQIVLNPIMSNSAWFAHVALRFSEFLWRFRFDLSICLGVALIATLVRLPNVLLIPRFTDEINHIIWAADLALGQGGPFRLRALDLYRGPIFEYLLVVFFRIFGLDPGLPRLVVLAFGAATVGCTYLMGRLMKGSIAGLVAAGLLATMPMHVLVNSHVAWSNSITPFFMTLGLALFYFGIQKERGFWLAVGTFALALGVQTHPVTVLFAPPLLLWFITRPNLKQWLHSPWLIIAVLTALLGYSNMILFNLQNNFASFNQAPARAYAFHIANDPQAFLNQLGGALTQFFVMISGGLERNPDPFWYLKSLPGAILVWAILCALIYTARRGNSFLLIVTGGYLLLLAWINQDYSFFQSRYLAPIAPLAYVALGVMSQDALTALARYRENADAASSKWTTLLRSTLVAVVVLALLWFMGQSIYQLDAFYRDQTQQGYTNATYLSMARRVVQRPNATAPVFVGLDLEQMKWDLGGGASSAAYYPLYLWNASPQWSHTWDLAAQLQELPTADAYLLITPRFFTSLKSSLPGYRFKELEVSPPQKEEPPNRIGLYQLIARP